MQTEYVRSAETWMIGSCDTHIILAQVGFLFSSQDLQGCGFANTIGPHQSEHPTRSGNWQPTHTQVSNQQTSVDLYNIIAQSLCSVPM